MDRNKLDYTLVSAVNAEKALRGMVASRKALQDALTASLAGMGESVLDGGGATNSSATHYRAATRLRAAIEALDAAIEAAMLVPHCDPQEARAVQRQEKVKPANPKHYAKVTVVG